MDQKTKTRTVEELLASSEDLSPAEVGASIFEGRPVPGLGVAIEHAAELSKELRRFGQQISTGKAFANNSFTMSAVIAMAAGITMYLEGCEPSIRPGLGRILLEIAIKSAKQTVDLKRGDA